MSTITIDDLKKIKLLGRGRFGTVTLCVYEPSNTYFAVKNIEYDRAYAVYVDREVANSQSIGKHPSIVQYYYHQTRPTAVEMQLTQIVLEYCAGGDIYESVIRRRPETLSLGIRQNWLKQMTEGLRFLHSKNIVHRDFKAENVLLTSATLEQADAKLSDLGISKTVEAKRREMISHVGTFMYFAPEQFSTEYNQKVDVWALGIFAYQLFTYSHPFEIQDIDDLKAKQSKLRDRPFITPNVHPALSDFIRLCFTYDPSQRPSTEDLLSHPLFTVDLSVPVPVVPIPPPIDYITVIHQDLHQAETQLQHIIYLRETFGSDFANTLAASYRTYLNSQLSRIQHLKIPQSEQWFTALSNIRALLSALIG